MFSKSIEKDRAQQAVAKELEYKDECFQYSCDSAQWWKSEQNLFINLG